MGRRSAPLERLAADLGAGVLPRPCDVTQPASIDAALGDVERVDTVIVNAGLCETGPIDAPDAEAIWRRVMAVNLDGAFNTLRVVGPRIVAGGRVVLVSSGLGHRGRPRYAAYTAAKHGVLGLCKALALEWAPRGITVNAVSPGWVDTTMARSDVARSAERLGEAPEAFRARAEEAIPLGRFVAADEVAALITWLTSDAARMITGQSYGISGGEVMG